MVAYLDVPNSGTTRHFDGWLGWLADLIEVARSVVQRNRDSCQRWKFSRWMEVLALTLHGPVQP